MQKRAALTTTAALATVLALGVATSALAGEARGDQGAEAVKPAVISLLAEGEVSVRPDLARISLGVSATAPTAKEAMAKDAEQMSRVIAALKAQGIEAKDIQTSNLTLNAEFDYQPNKPPRRTGYQASNTVTATVRAVDKAGLVLDAISEAGANQVNGVAFDLSDREKAADEARVIAVKRLSDKLALYERALGKGKARLVAFTEGGSFTPQPVMLDAAPVMAMRTMAAAPPAPVEAGEMKVRVTVSASWTLAD